MKHLTAYAEAEVKPMATPAQILANRENSKLSTGPRTEAGKAASSANARSHGFSAADPVLPTEDRNQFNALLEQYKSEWVPRTTHEEFLVSQMTGTRRKLARLERMEVEMLSGLDDPTQAFTDNAIAAGFARLERYRVALERTYHRCVRELRASRKEQNKPNFPQMTENEHQQPLAIIKNEPEDPGKPSRTRQFLGMFTPQTVAFRRLSNQRK